MKNVEDLKYELERILIYKTTKEWIKILEVAGVPVGPLNNVEEAINSTQIKSRNMIVTIKGDKSKKLKIAGNPIKFSEFKDPKNRGKVPRLNEHRKSLLKEFNIS